MKSSVEEEPCSRTVVSSVGHVLGISYPPLVNPQARGG